MSQLLLDIVNEIFMPKKLEMTSLTVVLCNTNSIKEKLIVSFV